jgi:hypothetical protein
MYFTFNSGHFLRLPVSRHFICLGKTCFYLQDRPLSSVTFVPSYAYVLSWYLNGNQNAQVIEKVYCMYVTSSIVKMHLFQSMFIRAVSITVVEEKACISFSVHWQTIPASLPLPILKQFWFFFKLFLTSKIKMETNHDSHHSDQRHNPFKEVDFFHRWVHA